MAQKEHVTIVGSGNLGSVVGKLAASNAAIHLDVFSPEVKMWVYEETVGNKKLSDIINHQHENVKYLPNVTLPENLVAVPDLASAVKGATILIFVLPHQFLGQACKVIKPHLIKKCKGISLGKGFHLNEKGQLLTLSEVIQSDLGIEISALSGANIANEIAQERFCETTIGCFDPSVGSLYKLLLQTPYFRINVIPDVKTPQICGALKNVVGLASGFVDGLQKGENAKVAVMRLGLGEMKKFARDYFEGVEEASFFESCGVADVIASCNGGRNWKLGKLHALTRKPLSDLEETELNGQKLQGTLTSREVVTFLKHHQVDLESEFPLFYSVYRIAYEGRSPEFLLSDIVR